MTGVDDSEDNPQDLKGMMIIRLQLSVLWKAVMIDQKRMMME